MLYRKVAKPFWMLLWKREVRLGGQGIPVEPTGTSSPRISLPKGSPSRPSFTATCRPRTWMQQITEGQINEPRREDASSSESNTSAIETLPEEFLMS